ncbi:MAG: queuosine precursor transporter [Clostridiales Family XIII bacterium]|nr:queuosine precursor transporter [Clostridiales Family XIII bacterium]
MKKQVAENPVQKNRAGEFTPLVVISGLMIAIYLTSNVMAVKVMGFFDTAILDCGTITFPMAYMLGDVLTEIWGFKTARKVIFLTFFCNVVLVVFTMIGVLIPSPEYLADSAAAYNAVFGYVPRIVASSLVGFLSGELVNAWLMVKIKSATGEKLLWVRTVGSSAAAYVFDTVLFCVIAFAGTIKMKDLLIMMAALYAAKLIVEAVCGTPLAYGLIGYLKKRYS